jgi:hypothetical protein
MVLRAGPASPVVAGHTGTADLYIDFEDDQPVDTAGRWTILTRGPYTTAANARVGNKAGLFRAPQTKLELTPERSQLFRPDQVIGDFSLEFWLNPTRADSGEIVLLWKATRRVGSTVMAQQVTGLILRNRLTFGFVNFFSDPGGKEFTLSLQGTSVILPGRWSHHLVRFDADTGLLEYLMDGKPEAIAYATGTGRQGGTVFAAISGSAGRLEIAPNYSGLLDAFVIHASSIDDPRLSRYDPRGGTATSPIYDLGSNNARMVSIAAATRTAAESAIHWSYRMGDSTAFWTTDSPEWLPFRLGASFDQGQSYRGRYIQIRMALYPDGAGERSPGVSSISFNFEPDLPPPPPGQVAVSAGNGTATVYWSAVAEADTRGYMLYYGLASGIYFGNDAREGPSPIRIHGASTTSATLTGLTNGRLYYLAIAAFDAADPPQIGDYSRELTVRPSRISQ